MARRLRSWEIPNPNPRPNPGRVQAQAEGLSSGTVFWLTTIAIFGGALMIVLVVNSLRNGEDNSQDRYISGNSPQQIAPVKPPIMQEETESEKQDRLEQEWHEHQQALALAEQRRAQERINAEAKARKEREAEEAARRARIAQQRLEDEQKRKQKGRLAAKRAREKRDAERKAQEVRQRKEQAQQRAIAELKREQVRRNSEINTAPWQTLFNSLTGVDSDQFDQIDRSHIYRAYQKAAQATLGVTIAWNNRGKNHHGWIVPVRDGTSSRGKYCRELQQAITFEGNTRSAFWIVCQNGANWEIYKNWQ